MKEYPTIDLPIIRDTPVYIFDKLDGSNIRAEWRPKRGFYKYGKRHALINDKDEQFGETIKLITDKYSEKLNKMFKDKKWEQALCFFEYHGPHSFAGSHRKDEEKTVTLIELSNKKGIIPPSEFLKLAADYELEIPSVLHYGKITDEIVEQIKTGVMPGMTYEGVVCKADKLISPGHPIMFKIKNRNWIDTLKIYCDGNHDLYKRLL